MANTPTDRDDLVARLNAVDHMCVEDCFMQSPLFSHAATRIQELEAERDALKAALVRIQDFAFHADERSDWDLILEEVRTVLINKETDDE